MHAGLLPYGLDCLTRLLEGTSGEGNQLPERSSWVLLLALQLLMEFRDPKSRHAPASAGAVVSATSCAPACSSEQAARLCGWVASWKQLAFPHDHVLAFTVGVLPISRWVPYLTMLPAPPGTRLAAVCSCGPPASDLLLFRHASALHDMVGNKSDTAHMCLTSIWGCAVLCSESAWCQDANVFAAMRDAGVTVQDYAFCFIGF